MSVYPLRNCFRGVQFAYVLDGLRKVVLVLPKRLRHGVHEVVREVSPYDDAGIAGIFGVLLVSVISGALVKAGVSLGLLFMILVAAPIITQILLAL